MLIDSLTRHLGSKYWKSRSSSQREDHEDHEQDEEVEGDEDEGEDEDFEDYEEPYRAPAYPYRPLGETEVRLLRIVPGTGTVECLLHQMPLAEVKFFYALSYVWGDTSHMQTIMLEGQPFLVTRNLYQVLHQFRQRPYDLGYPKDYFWVDAICINQDDLDERSCQIPRMMDIYHAGHVVIWLGHVKESPADGPSKKSLRKARSSRSRISTDEAIRIFFKKTESMWSDWEPVDDDDNVIIKEEFGDSYDAIIQIAANILQRPWFQRVWTIQEACLDAYPNIYVGRHSVHLAKLIDIWKILALEHRFLLLCSGSARMVALNRLDRLYRSSLFDWDDNPSKLEMAEVLAVLLRTTGKKSSTDPRDQLYGLLGLVKHLKEGELPEELAPDYRLSYEYVYWNYATFLFQSVGDLGLLDCGRNELQHVPSWVPDFRYLSHRSDPSQGASIRISSNRRFLYLQGCMLGTFHGFIPSCVSKDIWPTAKAVPSGLSTRLREFEEKVLKPSADIRGITVEEAFNDLIKNVSRIVDAEGAESFYEVYRRLSKSSRSKRSWYTKRKRTTNVRLKEEAITDQLSFPFLLLSDGTILGVRREDAEVKIGDLICVFKSATDPSLLRTSGESYKFLGHCEAKIGPLKQQGINDDFWVDRDIQDITLI
ncbi:HET-domain-containing protein [Hypoxylon crocopeplum]|nr:HET-domain-containing protein [Hypoxylon crocopeplum]